MPGTTSMKLIAVVKRDCETCQMVAPVLAALTAGRAVAVYSQDDPGFPELIGGALDDTSLELSWRLGIDTVPTLIRLDGEREVARSEGWMRAEWERITGVERLGAGLPESRPGCGSRSVDPGMPERLALRHGGLNLASRAIEAALRPEFSMHGLLATLWFSGPVVIVNGPVTRRIAMNSAGNALGQGNRANATIGRALQLLIRNVGGGVPGEIDRSVLGNPGKYTFCFAEDESDPDWVPLNVARGARGRARWRDLGHHRRMGSPATHRRGAGRYTGDCNVRNQPYVMRDPTAEISPRLRSRIPPPASLQGRTVGLLSISKERSEEFLDVVAQRLERKGIAVRRFAKPTHTKPAPESVIQEVVEHCDVVVEGLAD